jgi:hypothetical protein
MPIPYGKQIDECSFSNGKIVSRKRSIEQSIPVNGQLDVLTQVGAALKEEMSQTTNHKIVFEIIADPKTNQPVRVVKRYQIERVA